MPEVHPVDRGSRKFFGIVDDEMVMGFLAETLPEIGGALKIVVGAPGSKWGFLDWDCGGRAKPARRCQVALGR